MKASSDKAQQPEFILQPSLQVRSVTLLHNGTHLAVMGLLEILIIDIRLQATIKTIRRVSSPRSVISVSCQYLCVHYSDNMCILYDTYEYEAVYPILGMPHDHKGIRVSQDGRFMVYGNDTAMQVWNVFKCEIEMLSHKFKYISCYNINWCGSELYLGTFSGQLLLTKLLHYKTQYNTTSKVPYSQQLKPTTKCILSLQTINPTTIACLDYSLQCYIVALGNFSAVALCRIELGGQITKPVGMLHCEERKSLFVNVNECYYRLGLDGGVGLVGQGKEMQLARDDRNRKVKLIVINNKHTFLITDG